MVNWKALFLKVDIGNEIGYSKMPREREQDRLIPFEIKVQKYYLEYCLASFYSGNAIYS